MADQSVNVSNWPKGDSNARVAFEMLKWLMPLLPKDEVGEARIKSILDLYADCRAATENQRPNRR